MTTKVLEFQEENKNIRMSNIRSKYINYAYHKFIK